MCDVHVLSSRREVIKFKDLVCFSAIPGTRIDVPVAKGSQVHSFKVFLYNTQWLACVCVCVFSSHTEYKN